MPSKEFNILHYQKNVFFYRPRETIYFFPGDCKITKIQKKGIIHNKCYHPQLSFIGIPQKNKEKESFENIDGSFEENKF